MKYPLLNKALSENKRITWEFWYFNEEDTDSWYEIDQREVTSQEYSELLDGDMFDDLTWDWDIDTFEHERKVLVGIKENID